MLLKAFINIFFIFISLKLFAFDNEAQLPFDYFYTLVGVEFIHSPPPGVKVSAYVPLPKASEGHIEDLNSFHFNAVYPNRFTIGDGTLLAPFVFVNISEDSLLKKIILAHVKKILKLSSDQEEQIQILKSYVSQNVLSLVPDNDPFVLFFKKENYHFSQFQEVGKLKPGHFPVSTEFLFQTVKLEDLIRYGRGFCIHKVLVTSLMMKELRIPHVIRYGSTGNEGHDWIELPDGRILDPTWMLLEKPQASPIGGEWFQIGWTSLYKYDFYPFAVWN